LLLALVASLFTACLLSPSDAHAEPAQRAYVGVYLHDVTRFDQRNGTYDVDADVWLKWYGDLDPAALRVQNSCFDMEMVDLGETQDGDWHSHRYHLRGMLRGEFPLHRFPFDVQQLGIQFELSGVNAELVPDLAGSGLAERFSITGWDYEAQFTPRVQQLVYASDLGSIAGEGRSTKIQRVGFEVTLARPTVTIAVKLFLPLVLLLLIALIALYLSPELVDARAGIGVTVLLACFAFQFTVAGTIPDVSYLTVVDELFILAYGLAAVTLIITVLAYWLDRSGRSAQATKMDRYSRRIIPVFALLATWLMLLSTPDSEAQAATAPASLPARAESARDVLRIGTLRLRSAAYGLLRGPQDAGLTVVAPNGRRVGHLAEHAPSVANNQMKFFANGQLEITWTLREDLQWSDGHALTSDDFRFALEFSPDPNLVSIDTPDPRTLVLTYSDALAYALEGFSPLPRHAFADAVLPDGGLDAVRDARFTQVAPSAGPYRLAEFTEHERAVLLPNEHYVGPPPAIPRVEVRVFADTDALAAAFREGAVDAIEPGALAPLAAKALEQELPDAVIVRASEDLYALVPDDSVPLVSRLAVRRAMVQALNRRELATTVFGRFGEPAETPSRGVYAPNEDSLPYDVEAARAALEAAGALGETVRLTHSDDPVERRMAQLVTDAFTAAGLVVEDRELPAGDAGLFRRDHGGLLLALIRADEDEVDPRRYWNLPRVRGRFDTRARTFAYDDKTAQTVDRWQRALYVERRAQLQREIDQAVAGRLPVVPLVFGSERLARTPTLRDWDGGRRFGDTMADWNFTE
jgi:ABC-type transport system substrate-binding protein